jgi:hypothetical protein
LEHFFLVQGFPIFDVVSSAVSLYRTDVVVDRGSPPIPFRQEHKQTGRLLLRLKAGFEEHMSK